jgi:hypothetical protein
MYYHVNQRPLEDIEKEKKLIINYLFFAVTVITLCIIASVNTTPEDIQTNITTIYETNVIHGQEASEPLKPRQEDLKESIGGCVSLWYTFPIQMRLYNRVEYYFAISNECENAIEDIALNFELDHEIGWFRASDVTYFSELTSSDFKVSQNEKYHSLKVDVDLDFGGFIEVFVPVVVGMEQAYNGNAVEKKVRSLLEVTFGGKVYPFLVEGTVAKETETEFMFINRKPLSIEETRNDAISEDNPNADSNMTISIVSFAIAVAMTFCFCFLFLATSFKNRESKHS